ncbi:hypothetical protein ACXN5S_07675 [Pseudoroseicyclus sp. H15]
MRRRLLIHLGMNKAGSTTIQQAYSSYDDGQTEWLPLGGLHARFVGLSYADKPQNRLFTSADPEARKAEQAEFRAKLEEVLSEGEKGGILSAEDFSVFTPDEAERAAEHLAGNTDDLHALVYVRDPVGFIRSDYQQRIKRAMPPSKLAHFYPQYRRRFEGWDAAMDGRGRLEYARFSRETFHDGDLLADFAHRFGLDTALAKRNKKGDANTSLSAEAVAVLALLRSDEGAASHYGKENLANISLVRGLRDFGSSSFGFHPDLVAPVLKEWADDIAWMEERMGSRFPPDEPRGKAFASIDEMLAYGQSLGPDLASHIRELGHEPANSGDDILALLKGLRQNELAAMEARRAKQRAKAAG